MRTFLSIAAAVAVAGLLFAQGGAPSQPAPQGEPVVTAQEPEAPAQPEPEQEAPEQPQSTEPRCPHCGAPLEINASAKCPYCGSVITLEEHGFALNAIRAISQETRG